MDIGISNKDDASRSSTAPKWRPCNVHVVIGRELSSGLLKAGSHPEGFHAGLLSPPPQSPLSHNEFVGLDVETPARCRHGIRVIRRRRARLEDESPQLREVLTPVVKIRKTVPAKHSLAGPIPSPGQSSAKADSEPDTIPASVIPIPSGGNFVRQIPLGSRALDRVMAVDEIERTDEAAVAPTIAQAALDPVLAVAKELQQQIEDFDGFGRVARIRDASGSR
jgi:hypothetical protein